MNEFTIENCQIKAYRLINCRTEIRCLHEGGDGNNQYRLFQTTRQGTIRYLFLDEGDYNNRILIQERVKIHVDGDDINLILGSYYGLRGRPDLLDPVVEELVDSIEEDANPINPRDDDGYLMIIKKKNCKRHQSKNGKVYHSDWKDYRVELYDIPDTDVIGSTLANTIAMQRNRVEICYHASPFGKKEPSNPYFTMVNGVYVLPVLDKNLRPIVKRVFDKRFVDSLYVDIAAKVMDFTTLSAGAAELDAYWGDPYGGCDNPKAVYKPHMIYDPVYPF